MIPGLILIGAAIIIVALSLGKPMSDFHLFAALNVLGLGAVCCTVAWWGHSIRGAVRDFHASTTRETAIAPPPATRASDWKPRATVPTPGNLG
jgi:hypothetical protein